MENKEGGDFYGSLPKKELQDLCKKYGLSPYKTKSSLVTSLNSYFEKKNLSSLAPVGKSSVYSTALMPQLQFKPQFGNMADTRKDNGFTSPTEEDNRANNSLTVKCNGLGGCMGAESYNKASGIGISEEFGRSMDNIQETSRLINKKRETSRSNKDNLAFVGEVGMGNMPQIQHRNVNHGACLEANAYTSSVKSSEAVPSFEFYVRSEEGIDLFVDLNSSPPEWCKRLENEVCMCQAVHKNKFRSFREELEVLGNSNKQIKSPFLWNTGSDHNMNNGHVKIKSSPNSIMRENSHVEFDHPDGGDGTLRFTAIKPGSDAIEMSAHLEEEKELLLSSRLNSDVPDQMVSGLESSLGDGETKPVDSNVFNTPQIKFVCNSVSSTRLNSDVPDQMISGVESSLGDGETKPLDSNVFDTPQIKFACNSDVSSTSDGPKSLNTMEHQNSQLGNENCENLTPQDTSSLLNPDVVYPVAIGTVEMQLSEVASQRKDASCSPCENNCFLDFVDTTHNMETGDGGLANPSEVNHGTYGNHKPACAEELERNDLVNGMETSECLHFNKSLEKRSEDLVSDDGPKRKRKDCEYHNGFAQPEGKILRSSKRRAGEVLPRRSMRLVSK